MDKKTTLWVVLLLVAVAGVGVGVYYATKPADTKAPAVTSDANKDKDAEQNTSSEDETDVATASATITATSEGFSPATVTIKKGQSIKVVNNSSSPIEFSSADHPTHLEDPELNMKTLQPGESGTITPASVGTHGYHDHLNAGHTGSIVVTE